jgi:CPA2 family monovalent cation:H+ antiporter-2
LGMSMNVTSNFLYPVIVAVSAIPPSLPLSWWKCTPFQSFRTKITSEMVKKIARYSTTHKPSNQRLLGKLLRTTMLQIVIHTIIITAIILLSSNSFCR